MVPQTFLRFFYNYIYFYLIITVPPIPSQFVHILKLTVIWTKNKHHIIMKNERRQYRTCSITNQQKCIDLVQGF